jgi:dephospho-CoA kinase
MKAIGLTGGIGMGKSTVAQLLQGMGIPVVDTDELARLLVTPGQPALAEIGDRFGHEFLDSQGELRRDALARLVFADEIARRALEQILHPRIRSAWQRQVETWEAEHHAVAVVVIPLLFETGAEEDLDQTVCVACTVATQHTRLRERGWSDEEVDRRKRAQLPARVKMERADRVLWNEGSKDVLRDQVVRVFG